MALSVLVFIVEALCKLSARTSALIPLEKDKILLEIDKYNTWYKHGLWQIFLTKM